METSHQPTSRGLPRPIRGLLVNQAPAHKQSDTLIWNWFKKGALEAEEVHEFDVAYYKEKIERLEAKVKRLEKTISFLRTTIAILSSDV
ncbi:hypothetical protein CIP107518_00163 [Corynebacterium diphtheriae]|nr:hypothetical protein CIP107518_00163 [Corynebacterium diphtheriae]